jgi:putative flippase GtrA
MIDYKHTFGQFWRYVIIGLINTGIDFAVLNILAAAGGITSGNGLIPLNIISFSTAVVTGYFLRKRWSFQDLSQTG